MTKVMSSTTENEVYKYQHLDLALNRDSGDLRISELYFGFLKRKTDTLLIP